MLQFFIGFAVFFWIIGLGVTVLMIIASWKVFEKAGEPGWAILVPFYNAYIVFKISWGNGLYFLLSICPALGYMISSYALTLSAMRMGLGSQLGIHFSEYANFAWAIGFMLVFLLMMYVISIITYVKLAKVFGQGGGFACGLIFLAPVFLCILAFSKNIFYVGILGKSPLYGQPIVGNPFDPRNQPPAWQDPYYRPELEQQSRQAAYEGTKYCADCGAALAPGDTFCSRCGKPQ